MGDLTREDLIEILYQCLAGQMRALKTMRRGVSEGKRRGPRNERSNMALVEDILKSNEGPLHVEQIIQIAQSKFHRTLSRESLVSALTKKVLDENVFCRVDRNTFDLIERHRD